MTVTPLLTCLFLTLIVVAKADDDKEGIISNGNCSALADNCDTCMSSADCAWCLDPGFVGDSRCSHRDWFASNSDCQLIEDPQNEVIVVKAQDLTIELNKEEEEAKFVQITPQLVRMKLRVGKKEKLRFQVAQAKQYPVDIYYLMDLSNSMSDDKDTIVKLAEKIGQAIANITKDFKIGFGSFVDKEVLPFISLVPEKNCQQDSCPKPYSFQHQMSLSPDVKVFQQRVQDAKISGNIDNPEGGFDGLVQVMVCEEKIGWRKESRRVIIFTTDQSFHIALDGKLGGLVMPNDGHCHLNETGFYTHSTILDYPSIGQVNYLAEKYSFNVIWAVSEDQFDLYSNVASMVEGSLTGVISEDSSNIVSLIRKQYEAITTSIKVQANASTSCSTEIKSKCPDGGPECFDIPLGTPVDFELEVTLHECLDQAETIVVSPVGLKDQLVVEIESICECPCKEDQIEDDLMCTFGACNGHGHLRCGECQCCDSFYGPVCECDPAMYPGVNPLDPWASCKNGSAICSGRGACVCGMCECLQEREGTIISGDFCQEVCDNTACPQDKYRNLCSGHGECRCGTCHCNEGWRDDACDCKVDPDQCRSPESPDLICSGVGECPCDKCICTSDWHSGQYCEICETCQDMCQRLQPCVECLALESGPLVQGPFASEEERRAALDNCTLIHCQFDFRQAKSQDIPDDWENCTIKYPPNCEYTFSYSNFHPTNHPKFVIAHIADQEEDDKILICPPPPDYVGIFLGVIGAVVFLGILTLFLWKTFTTIHDRREFAKFEAERQRMRFPAHSNPIFKQATTTVQNPIFNSPYD